MMICTWPGFGRGLGQARRDQHCRVGGRSALACDAQPGRVAGQVGS